jgi:hypothetical protein
MQAQLHPLLEHWFAASNNNDRAGVAVEVEQALAQVDPVRERYNKTRHDLTTDLTKTAFRAQRQAALVHQEGSALDSSPQIWNTLMPTDQDTPTIVANKLLECWLRLPQEIRPVLQPLFIEFIETPDTARRPDLVERMRQVYQDHRH